MAQAELVSIAGRARITGAHSNPSTAPSAGGSVGAAYAAFLAVLAGHPPLLIPVEADPIDLQDRADHLNVVFGALAVYLAIVLDDTAQNTPGRLDLSDAEAILADLASDLAGAIQLAADALTGEWP
jgi:hypothetical protein